MKPRKIIYAVLAVLPIISCSQDYDSGNVIDADHSAVEINDEISNLNVNAFCEDKYGHIWIGTDRGLNRYTGHEFYQYFSGNGPCSINNNTVSSFFRDTHDRIWVITISGVCLLNDDGTITEYPVRTTLVASSKMIELGNGEILLRTSYGELLKLYEKEKEFRPLNNSATIPIGLSIFPSREDYFWNVTTSGIYLMNLSGESTLFPVEKDITHCTMDKTGKIWITHNTGISIFDPVKRTYSSDSPECLIFSHQKVTGLYSTGPYVIFTTDNNIWFYNTDNGLIQCDTDNTLEYSLPNYCPTSFFIDSNENLWMGQDGKGFHISNNKNKLFNRDETLCKEVEGSNISCMAISEDNHLWLIDCEGLLYIYDNSSGYQKYTLKETGIADNVSMMLATGRGNGMWIAAGKSIYKVNCSSVGNLYVTEAERADANVRRLAVKDDFLYTGLSNGTIVKYDSSGNETDRFSLPSQRAIYDMQFLSDGKLLITQFREDIILLEPDGWGITPLDYRSQLGEMFHILTSLESTDGSLWFGTRDYGILHYSRVDGTFEQFDDLSCKQISAIEEDESGCLWISTSYGLNHLNTSKMQSTRYFRKSGIGGNQFSVEASCKMPNGTIIFGGAHGITTCNIAPTGKVGEHRLVFENIEINGKQTYIDDIYDSAIYESPAISLKHNQNTISVSFSALDYDYPESSIYSSRLEGYDKTWTNLGIDHTVHYSNLPPGNYTLHIQHYSADNNDIKDAFLPISIRRHPLLTMPAILVYSFLVFALLHFILTYTRREMRFRMVLEQSEREKEHERYINRMNLNFFANMAHEFRTPLTMIAGPIAQFERGENRTQQDIQLLNAMKNSVTRMEKLTDQLLDLNKIDNDSLKLKIDRKANITGKLARIANLTAISASEQGITLGTSGLEEEFLMPLDTDKFESIIGNLLSNALKYTNQEYGKGFIEVAFRKNADQSVSVLVSNNGNPIDEDKMEMIFDRYFQLKEHTEHSGIPGSGIGLYFARALAERMHGTLRAENLEEGKGVCFTLTLPCTDDAYNEEDYVRPILKEDLAETSSEDGTGTQTPHRKILVVDDDPDLANYLSIILSPHYNTECARNAEEALSIVSSKNMPDIVLSDIVMPGEDGISLCRKIKEDLVTCHIPVILVTAKVGVNNSIKGLESGADAYVTKPFDPAYILALIQSILRNRDLLKGEFATSSDISEVDGKLLSARDNEFIQKLYKIMEDELASHDLDIAKVADALCVSRSALFYKVKNLTGMSPILLFRTYRMNVALKLLKEGKYNVSDVADMVGYNSLSYFSRAFKEQFGINPKECIGKTS